MQNAQLILRDFRRLSVFSWINKKVAYHLQPPNSQMTKQSLSFQEFSCDNFIGNGARAK